MNSFSELKLPYRYNFIQISGANLQTQNIADSGSVKEAYYAYNNWVQRNGVESLLPGLKYNQKQLFWISFAQTWCSASQENFNVEVFFTDPSDEFRVMGVLRNMPEFASDFSCPVESKMNPMKKCSIW